MTRIERIVAGLKEVSELLQVHPAEVTKAQLLKNSGDAKVSEWDIKQIPGGLSGIKKAHFPIVGKDLVASRKIKAINKYVSDLERRIGEKELFEDEMLTAIDLAISKLPIKKVKLPKIEKSKHKSKMTLELMVSDVHYGKKTGTFDLVECRKRMKKLTQVFLQEVEDSKKLFNVNRVIIALIGDIIESFEMHGLESAASCEFGTSRQVDEAIESLFFDVLYPIGMTGISIDVPCVTGNHDRTSTNRTMNYPGQSNVTWIIYRTLRRLSEAYGFKNMTFHIPKDSYILLDIYGSNCLYEHGDNSKASTKSAFEALINSRSRQMEKVIHFGRFGHWHEYVCYDRGRIIVNESVCGQDSYARVKGFKSSAGQTINYYVETKNRPNSFYKSFPVYLG